MHQQEDKIDLLLTEIVKAQDENVAVNKQLELVAAEKRGLESEVEQVKRGKQMAEGLVSSMEKEKGELERKVQKLMVQ